jgi:predicted DNA-binding transcriptional regulator AlpA
MQDYSIPAPEISARIETKNEATPPPRSVPRFVRTPEAAIHLGLSRRTLEKHRCYGTGPVFRKLGGRVVYEISDLDEWADRGLRTSTSDPGRGTVLPAKRRYALTR